MYNPAVHMLWRGQSSTSVFTWLILGGLSLGLSDMAVIRALPKVGLQFLSSFDEFLGDAVLGLDLRVEVVLSSRTASELFTHVPDYGTRLLDFCLGSEVLALGRQYKNQDQVKIMVNGRLPRFVSSYFIMDHLLLKNVLYVKVYNNFIFLWF